MYILNSGSGIKETTIKKIRDFIFENCYKWIGFSKENNYYSAKSLSNWNLIIRRIPQQPKTFENANIVDI